MGKGKTQPKKGKQVKNSNTKNLIIKISGGVVLVAIVALLIFAVANKSQTTRNETNEVLSKKNTSETIVLSDKVYITQINDIWANTKDYKGKNIEIEGFPMTQGSYKYVGRYGPRML